MSELVPIRTRRRRRVKCDSFPHFARDSDGTAELAEEGEPVPETQEEDRNERVRLPAASQDDFPTGAYLSDDDIEEW